MPILKSINKICEIYYYGTSHTHTDTHGGVHTRTVHKIQCTQRHTNPLTHTQAHTKSVYEQVHNIKEFNIATSFYKQQNIVYFNIHLHEISSVKTKGN